MTRVKTEAQGASSGGGENNFGYTEILSSETLTIPVRQQMILAGGLTLDGTLVLGGELILI